MTASVEHGLVFRCEHYSRGGAPTLLSEHACVERQYAARKVSGRYVFATFAYCAGACEQGRAIAKRHPDLVGERKRPRVRPLRLPSEVICLARPPVPASSLDRDDGGSPLDYAAIRLADKDAARSAELWGLIRKSTRCTICDRRMNETNESGVCFRKACKREYRLRLKRAREAEVAAAPEPPPPPPPLPPEPPSPEERERRAQAASERFWGRPDRFAPPGNDPLADALADARPYSVEERLFNDERMVEALRLDLPSDEQIAANDDFTLLARLGIACDYRPAPGAAAPAALPPPSPQEKPMPCRVCKNHGHNASTCPKKPTTAPPKLHAVKAKPAPKRSALDNAFPTPMEERSIEALVAGRARAVLEIEAIDDELRRRRTEIERALSQDTTSAGEVKAS